MSKKEMVTKLKEVAEYLFSEEGDNWYLGYYVDEIVSTLEKESENE